MMENNGRKLKRGLSDISDIFSQEQPKIDKTPEVLSSKQDVQMITVVCPDAPSVSKLLNAWFASRMSRLKVFSAIIDLKGSEPGEFSFENILNRYHMQKGNVPNLTLNPHAFLKACEQRIFETHHSSSGPKFLCLHYENADDAMRRKIHSLLDKAIIYVRPTLRGITESYKWIKQSYLLNRCTEYYLIFDGDESDFRGKTVFEHLSRMVSENLHSQLFWLGNLKFFHLLENDEDHLHYDSLFLHFFHGVMIPEKLSLDYSIHASRIPRFSAEGEQYG